MAFPQPRLTELDKDASGKLQKPSQSEQQKEVEASLAERLTPEQRAKFTDMYKKKLQGLKAFSARGPGFPKPWNNVRWIEKRMEMHVYCM